MTDEEVRNKVNNKIQDTLNKKKMRIDEENRNKHESCLKFVDIMKNYVNNPITEGSYFDKSFGTKYFTQCPQAEQFINDINKRNINLNIKKPNDQYVNYVLVHIDKNTIKYNFENYSFYGKVASGL